MAKVHHHHVRRFEPRVQKSAKKRDSDLSTFNGNSKAIEQLINLIADQVIHESDIQFAEQLLTDPELRSMLSTDSLLSQEGVLAPGTQVRIEPIAHRGHLFIY